MFRPTSSPAFIGQSSNELQPSSKKGSLKGCKKSFSNWLTSSDALGTSRSTRSSQQTLTFPRFCQVKALKMHSGFYPDNYWFAKSSLNRAYDICISCESSYRATERDLEALTDVKKGVEIMLHKRTTQYCEHWKAKGKELPTEDEWYEIAQAEDGETVKHAGCWFEGAKDENGAALSSPVKAWPFDDPGRRPVLLTSLLFLS